MNEKKEQTIQQECAKIVYIHNKKLCLEMYHNFIFSLDFPEYVLGFEKHVSLYSPKGHEFLINMTSVESFGHRSNVHLKPISSVRS